MNSEFKNEILMDGFLVSKDLENKKFQIKNNDDIIIILHCFKMFNYCHVLPDFSYAKKQKTAALTLFCRHCCDLSILRLKAVASRKIAKLGGAARAGGPYVLVSLCPRFLYPRSLCPRSLYVDTIRKSHSLCQHFDRESS